MDVLLLGNNQTDGQTVIGIEVNRVLPVDLHLGDLLRLCLRHIFLLSGRCISVCGIGLRGFLLRGVAFHGV